MKKLVIIILCLTASLPTKAQGDAAAITAFLAPFFATFQGLSEATGMDINDLKETAQKAIKITSDIVKTYKESTEMIEVGNNSREIYVQYLEGLKYLYEHSIYFSDKEMKEIVYLLDYAAFNLTATDVNRSKGLNNVAGGALSKLPDLFKWQNDGGNTSIKDMADLMDDTQKKVRKTLSNTKTINRYIVGVVKRKQYLLGETDINKFKKQIAKKYGL